MASVEITNIVWDTPLSDSLPTFMTVHIDDDDDVINDVIESAIYEETGELMIEYDISD